MNVFFCVSIAVAMCSVSVQGQNIDDQEWKLKISQEMKDLKARAERLEERVEVLEKSNSEYQNIISSCEKENIGLKTEYSGNRERSNGYQNKTIEERLQHVEELSKTTSLRSCAEYADYGMTQSGMFTIDPDGNHVGLPAFDVYCNMSTGTTEIHHDMEYPVDITPCEEDFCYHLNVSYSAPMEQIKALIDLSESCYQGISFSCFLSALSIGDDPVGLWINRHNETETYFTGSHHGQHICECGLDGTCSDSQHGLLCNCDGDNIPEVQSDMGTIDNSTALPIMGFLYGRMKDSQMAFIQIGRLVCQGSKVIPKNEIADSCSNLKRSGVVESGNFVLNDHSIARCDMEKSVDDDDIQTHVGDLSYKNSMFFAMSNSLDSFIPSGRVSFDYTQYDYKGNFDRTTGTFTASEDGLHAFFFSGRLGAPYATNDKYVDVFVNGKSAIEFRFYNSDGFTYYTMTEFWTLELKQGDTVYMNNRDGDLYVNNEKPMFFMGYFIN